MLKYALLYTWVNNSFSWNQKAWAWAVHIFSICGLLAGFMSILAIDGRNFRAAMGWLFVSLAIDGIDGTFARYFRVREVLPSINGKTIDYVIDFSTYAIIPAYFIYVSNVVPICPLSLAFLILVVSALYYGKDSMVSDDYYFIGFPVMWNMVAFYLYFVFWFSPLTNAVVIVICAILHFVPIKFAYPSRATRFRVSTILVTSILIICMPFIVYEYPAVPPLLRVLAIVCLGYFIVITANEMIVRTK